MFNDIESNIVTLYQTNRNLLLWVYNPLTVLFGKSKIVSFTSSIIKNIIVVAKSLVKLIYCIAFGLTFGLLKSIGLSF